MNEATVSVEIKTVIVPVGAKAPVGKLGEAELCFSGGVVDGMRLVGFGVWQRKEGGRNVTFPARQYLMNGETRTYALFRPMSDPKAQERLRDAILRAFPEDAGGGSAIA
jgi:hypothetical protein